MCITVEHRHIPRLQQTGRSELSSGYLTNWRANESDASWLHLQGGRMPIVAQLTIVGAPRIQCIGSVCNRMDATGRSTKHDFSF